MNSKPTYFEDTYKFEAPAIVESLQKDEKGIYITLDQTIFYPQGGGQPSDQGHIMVADIPIQIQFVRMVGGEIRHYIEHESNTLIGHKVMCMVDAEKRLLHAKLHTFGHLLSNVVESSYPLYKAKRGHHFPGECSVEFGAKGGYCEMINLDLLNQKITESITENLLTHHRLISSEQLSEICPGDTYEIPANQSLRVVRIGDYKFQLCGGTHVRGTSELLGLGLTKFKIKGGTLKINYAMG